MNANAVLGTEMTERLAGMRAELCLQRDAAAALVQEIDRVLGNGASSTQPPSRPVQKTSEPGKGIMQHALAVLANRGPLSTPDLLRALESAGFTINGKRPIQTLTAVLHKDRKATNARVTRRNGFWQLV